MELPGWPKKLLEIFQKMYSHLTLNANQAFVRKVKIKCRYKTFHFWTKNEQITQNLDEILFVKLDERIVAFISNFRTIISAITDS